MKLKLGKLYKVYWIYKSNPNIRYQEKIYLNDHDFGTYLDLNDIIVLITNKHKTEKIKRHMVYKVLYKSIIGYLIVNDYNHIHYEIIFEEIK